MMAVVGETLESGERSGAQVDVPVIDMVRPMPGFPAHGRFALVELDDEGLLCSLTSLDEPGLRFLVVAPSAFFDDYTPLVDDTVVAELGLEDDADLAVLVVLTAAQSLADTTANLRAPVLINVANRRGCQVVLDDESLPLAGSLVR